MSDHPKLTYRLSPHPNRMATPVKPSIDDQFSWWYDEMLVNDATRNPHNPISHYDIAALAWHEAWKRAAASHCFLCNNYVKLDKGGLCEKTGESIRWGTTGRPCFVPSAFKKGGSGA